MHQCRHLQKEIIEKYCTESCDFQSFFSAAKSMDFYNFVSRWTISDFIRMKLLDEIVVTDNESLVFISNYIKKYRLSQVVSIRLGPTWKISKESIAAFFESFLDIGFPEWFSLEITGCELWIDETIGFTRIIEKFWFQKKQKFRFVNNWMWDLWVRRIADVIHKKGFAEWLYLFVWNNGVTGEWIRHLADAVKHSELHDWVNICFEDNPQIGDMWISYLADAFSHKGFRKGLVLFFVNCWIWDAWMKSLISVIEKFGLHDGMQIIFQDDQISDATIKNFLETIDDKVWYVRNVVISIYSNKVTEKMRDLFGKKISRKWWILA